jgi:hypothetical protein
MMGSGRSPHSSPARGGAPPATGACQTDDRGRGREAMIAASRFELAELERSYSAGPRIGAYLYRGVARIGAPGARHPRA